MDTTEEQLGVYATCLLERDDIMELRLLPVRTSSWVTAGQLPATGERFARLNRAEQNIYIGANPRRQDGGKTAVDVLLARSLFADWDGVGEPEAHRRWQATGLPEPTVIIHSGHGIHAYWRLLSPIGDMARWSSLQRRLIAVLGSDKSIFDPPRIMRLPGFDNVKRRPHVQCRILSADPSRRYLLAELECRLPEILEPATPEVRTSGTQSAPASQNIIERAWRYLDKLPRSVAGQHGHDKLFRAACVLTLQFRLTPGQAFPLLAEWNLACSPPWSEHDLRRKLSEAAKQPGPRGTFMDSMGRSRRIATA